MNVNILDKVKLLIKKKKIKEAQMELSKLGPDFHRNPEYLYLRSEIFYMNKLYYIALDTLLITLEFKEEDKTYDLIGKIYSILGNEELSKKISDPNLRFKAINSLKDELSGIYRKDED